MQYYKNPGRKLWPAIIQRPVAEPAGMEKTVRSILKKVKKKGDKAVLQFTKEFDGVNGKKLSVRKKELAEAETLISDDLKKSIQLAKKNIELFHGAQKEEVIKIAVMPGIDCWREPVAIEKVGLYIPGGTAPLFSTVLMLGIPAQLAGCREIVLCSPPLKNGKIHPAILYAAQLCGITKIFKAGGVQAIAAMAYGTESIPGVYKIFGPGNQYVTIAKQMVQQEGVAIDMPAGPSELLVVADETAIPEYVAADLLSQAEHGPDSQVILATTSEVVAAQVMMAVNKQAEKLPRKKIIAAALRNSKVILVRNMEEAIALSNKYAPEHLILACADAIAWTKKIISAGSVFVGNYSPESAGDYASGTNHTLPTNGYAAMYSGVSLDSFVKKISYQQVSKMGLQSIGQAVMIMAEAEGLAAHKRAIAIRLNDIY